MRFECRLAAPPRSVFGPRAFDSQIGKAIPLVDDIEATVVRAVVAEGGLTATVEFDAPSFPFAGRENLIEGRYTVQGLHVLDGGVIIESFQAPLLSFKAVPAEPSPPAASDIRRRDGDA